jgi:cysteine desulfurase/selenocysteine lyase
LAPGPEFDLDQLSALSAVAAGFPDPAEIARLANEFFSSVPFAPQSVAGAASAPRSLATSVAPVIAPAGSAPLPTDAATEANGALTEANLAAIPASLSSAAEAPTVIPGVPIATDLKMPGVPGGVSLSDFSSVPSYGFIEGARPLFSSTPTKSISAAPPAETVKFPAETELRGLTPAPSGLTQPVSSKPAEQSAPQVPGAVAHDVQRGRPATYDFVGSARPLAPINVTPSLSPVDAQSGADAISGTTAAPFDVGAIRRDFPILQERVSGGRPLVWLDNAATTQKPQSVIDRLAFFYQHENSNVHRAAHDLAARSTDAYEAAREKVAKFLNASSSDNIVFVRGATEGVNLVAQSWGRRNIQQGDEIIVTWLEHHANIVPWQQLASEKGASLRVAPVDDNGQILLDEYEKLFTPRTRLVSLAHVSNALGTVTPVAEMVATAHRYGAKALVDGAQAVSHMPVDVQALDPDFYVFSGHKIFGPTGIGVVYGKPEALETTPPWQGGGNMIVDVTFERTIYQSAPARFEAGTGNIAGAVGLGAAIDYVSRLGMANIARYEHNLLQYGVDALQRIPGLHLVGTAREKASVLSFVLDGFSTEDVGKALSREGIAVRAGHHCAQPILRRFGLESTVRPSLAFYNTCEEIDALAAVVWNLKTGRGPGL